METDSSLFASFEAVGSLDRQHLCASLGDHLFECSSGGIFEETCQQGCFDSCIFVGFSGLAVVALGSDLMSSLKQLVAGLATAFSPTLSARFHGASEASSECPSQV